MWTGHVLSDTRDLINTVTYVEMNIAELRQGWQTISDEIQGCAWQKAKALLVVQVV